MNRKKRIILYYDNFVRDYRGLLLLAALLREKGNKVWIHALWDNAIDFIKTVNPDTVVMGQIGEYSTSLIGYFVYESDINLVINTAESVNYGDKLDVFFRFNFKEFNEKYIAIQVIPSRDLYNFVLASEIVDKNKYKFIGFPRTDFSVDNGLRVVEKNYLTKKYDLMKYKTIILYVSSFIFDQTGGQVTEENKNDIDIDAFVSKEAKLKMQHEPILKRLQKEMIKEENLLLIKKHPWDKSSYFENTYAGSNCIVVDNHDYIAPLIHISDMLLHTESTSALEAWIQGKRTISIIPDFDGDRSKLKNHMRQEIIVTNYEELAHTIAHYPLPCPSEASLENYGPFLDGKATIRLANEINKLYPKTDKKKSERNSLFRSFIGAMTGIKRYLIKKRIDLSAVSKDDYLYNYLLWETKKEEVEKRYKKAIKQYIKENAALIR